jgi:hypothetical protein
VEAHSHKHRYCYTGEKVAFVKKSSREKNSWQKIEKGTCCQKPEYSYDTQSFREKKYEAK